MLQIVVKKKSGAAYVKKLFNEGSYVSFARSEAMLQVSRTTNMILEGTEYAPHVC